MSGKSNVLWWLEQHKVAANEPLVDRIFAAAKQSNHLLSDDDIWAIVRSAPAVAKEMTAEAGVPVATPRARATVTRAGRSGPAARRGTAKRAASTSSKRPRGRSR